MNRSAQLFGVALLAGSVLWWGVWGSPRTGENRSAPQLLMEAACNARASFLGRQTSTVGRQEVKAEVARRGELARYHYEGQPGQPARVVLERPEGVYVFWPSVQEGWRIHRRPAAERPVACAQLCATNYRWEAGSGDGGTLVLTAYRRSDRQLARKFWVDTQHNLLTRVESYAPGGLLTSSWTLSELDFSREVPESLFDPPATARPAVEMEHPQPATSLDQAAQRVGFTPEIPNWVPDGYQLVEVWTEFVQGQPSLRMVYSDGLETFSLLETLHDAQTPLTQSVGRAQELEIHKWSDGRLDYTLLGSESNPAHRQLARAFIQGGNSAPVRGVVPILERGWQRLGSLF